MENEGIHELLGRRRSTPRNNRPDSLSQVSKTRDPTSRIIGSYLLRIHSVGIYRFRCPRGDWLKIEISCRRKGKEELRKRENYYLSFFGIWTTCNNLEWEKGCLLFPVLCSKIVRDFKGRISGVGCIEVGVACLATEKGSCCTPTIAASYQTAIAAPRGCLFETGTRCNDRRFDLPKSRSGIRTVVVGTNVISLLTSRS